MTFERALQFTLGMEGGYSKHPFDRGNATMMGVTQGTYSRWLADNNRPEQDVVNITHDQVERIYREEYWNGNQCDKLPWPLSAAHFDTAVNCGGKNATRILQRALGRIRDDGILGFITLNAAAVCSARQTTFRHGDFRSKFYCDIAKNDTTQLVFLYGWLHRVRQFEGVFLRHQETVA